MDSSSHHYQPYSWHQSHDQATVLFLVPNDIVEEDVSITIEKNHLIAGVRGKAPSVKGRLYGTVDTANSLWQLEPRASRHGFSAHERTTSTTSTVSTHSSFAFVSDPDFSSSFAASLDNGLISDADDPVLSSPALSSPISSTMDDHYGYTMPSQRHTQNTISSYPSSPPNEPPPYSMTSSHSSVDSVHGGSGRLVTIHLEKTESIIWPSLIVGPVPVALSRPGDGFEEPIYPWASSAIIEADYNMDPTSLVLIGLDLCDIREAYTDAFEYFVRAWHQASVPSATIRLVTHYLPLHTSLPSDYLTSTVPSEAEGAKDEPSTPTPTASTWLGDPSHGTTQYYLSRIGHDVDLAQLYRCAGMLHHEGRATALLSSAYTGLSSLRSPVVVSGNTGHGYGSNLGSHAHSSEEWKRNQDCAWQYLERARMLNPAIENPLSLRDSESEPSSGAESGDAKGSRSGAEPCRKEQQQTHFKMPTIEVTKDPPANQPRRRRKKTSGDLSSSFMENCRETPDVDDDRTWYLYIPGLVGAGTALLVVGFLSFSSWRKSQGGS